MDLILESNKSSNILSSLTSVEQVDLSSDMAPSFPLMAKDLRVNEAATGGFSGSTAMNGQSGHFRINKAYLLTDMAFKIDFVTVGAVLPVSYYPGFHLLDNYSISSAGKVLLSVTDADLVARVSCLSMSRKLEAEKRALALNAGNDRFNVASTAASTTYVPIFCSWFESSKQYFDSYFWETIQVNFRFNTLARAAIPAAVTAVNVTSIQLYTWSVRYDERYMSMLRAKNANPQRSLNQLWYQAFSNRTPCTGVNSTVVNLNNNYAAFKTVVQVIPINTTGAQALYRPVITTLRIDLGGQTFWQNIPFSVGSKENQQETSAVSVIGLGASTFALSYQDNGAVVVEWGLMPQDWTSVSGALSYANINAPQITVSYDTIVPANYEVAVSHWYWSILSSESSNGSIQVTVAN